MIEFKDLSIHFHGPEGPVRAVDGVSLSIGEGEVYGIVGSSGAGKSTLLRSINGLEKPTKGEVRVNGRSIGDLRGRELRRARMGIGMVFQHFNLISGKTVAANIAFPLEVAGTPRAHIDKRVDELLDLVGLSDKKKEYPGRLSGGQKQRVGIARALANEAKILLCDEPTSALDPDTAESILHLLESLARDLSITIVIITHELDVVKGICDRMAVMNSGRVVESGEIYELFTRPRDEFTKKLIEGNERYSLPEAIVSEIRSRDGLAGRREIILKLGYVGESADEPVLFGAAKSFDVSINIIHGKIEYIHGTPKGILFVSISGPDDSVERARAYLTEKTYRLEEVL